MLAAVGRLSREPQTVLLTESFVFGLWSISLTGTVMSLPGSSFVSIDEHWAAIFFSRRESFSVYRSIWT